MRQLTLTDTLEFYDVPQILATTLLQPADVTDDMLPEPGYYFDASDLADDAESQTDAYRLEVPVQDRATFSTLISRMGWHASSLGKTLRKIAAL